MSHTKIPYFKYTERNMNWFNTHPSFFKNDINKNLKDTWYLWGKNSENMQLLDVLVCNLANKPWYISWITGQNVQKLPIFAS